MIFASFASFAVKSNSRPFTNCNRTQCGNVELLLIPALTQQRPYANQYYIYLIAL